MKRQLLLCLAATVASCFLLAEESFAQHPYGYPGNFHYNRYLEHLFRSDRLIPYFAEHPPVYYSRPVARPYGYSPYAYPACACGRSYESHDAEFVPNPYGGETVPPEEKSDAEETSARHGAPRPLVVFNPYVQQGRRVASSDSQP